MSADPQKWLETARAHLGEIGPDDPGRGELEAAISRVSSKYERTAPEERGAKEGFISQQYPTSAIPSEQGATTPTQPDPERTHRTAFGYGPYSMTSQPETETLLPASVLPREHIETSQEASRRIAARPPELIQPPGPSHPLISPLAAIYDYLPTWAGGKTEMWEEPNLLDFRSDPDSRQAFGPGVDKLGVDSPEYQDYADRRWAEAYDTAQLMGQNIVRQSQAKGITENGGHLGVTASRGLTNLGGTMAGLAAGFNALAAPGASSPNAEAAADEYPLGGAIGNLLGAFSPKGATGIIGNALSDVIGPAKATGIAGAAGRGAVVGGLTGGGVRGLQDAGDAVRGNPHSDEAARIAEAMALGTGGGAIAGTGGALTRGLRDPLTPEGRELNLLETALAGGENNPPERATRFLGGLKVTPGAEAAAAESKALGDNRGVSPTDILAGKVAEPIARTALAEDAALKADIGRTDRNFYGSNAGQNQVAPRAFVRTLRNRIEKGTFDDGSSLPLEHGAELKKALNDAVEVFPVKPGDEAPWARRYKGNVISVREANQLGLRVAGNDTDKVIMIPKPMNAEQMDITLRNVDSNANAASIRGSEDPVWGELQRAGRIDRDRFGSDMSLGKVEPVMLPDGTELKGWGAYKHHVHEQIKDIERRMVNAGIPQGKNVGLEQATEGVRQNAIGFREPNRAVQDKALMSFMGGQTSPLWDITSARYGRTLQPTNSLSRTSVLRNLQLRLDPTFARAERYAMPLGIAAGTGDLGAGAVAGYHDLRDLTPFTFQDMLNKLHGEKPHENHPRKTP